MIKSEITNNPIRYISIKLEYNLVLILGEYAPADNRDLMANKSALTQNDTAPASRWLTSSVT